MRRSALDFLGGKQSMSLAKLSAILAVTAQPLSADFAGARFIQLYLYAHRVDGLQPGVYRFWPERAELEQVKSGDQRVAAAGLSLGQDLAGNACVTFSMIGDLERAAHTYGDRGYRYAHFEIPEHQSVLLKKDNLNDRRKRALLFFLQMISKICCRLPKLFL